MRERDDKINIVNACKELRYQIKHSVFLWKTFIPVYGTLWLVKQLPNEILVILRWCYIAFKSNSMEYNEYRFFNDLKR